MGLSPGSKAQFCKAPIRGLIKNPVLNYFYAFGCCLNHNCITVWFPRGPKENTTSKGHVLNFRETCSRHLCFCDDSRDMCFYFLIHIV